MHSRIEMIVGLGNPGPQYDQTRHNAGQDFVLELARQAGHTLNESPKFFGYTGKVTIGSRELKLLIPTTYMNRSGQAVGAFSTFYKIAPESILVAHDELDLSPGSARFKFGGGHGGHNGLRDIISSLGNNKNFGRLRLGIGHPGHAKDVSNFVLKKAPKAEKNLIEDTIYNATKFIPLLLEGDWEAAMKELHTLHK